MHPVPAKTRLLLTAMGVALLSNCGEGSETPSLQLRDPWVRPAVVAVEEDGTPTPGNSAVYLKIENPGPESDVLVGCETVEAERAEVHESFLEGDVMRMREVERVELPAWGEVELRPGGLHIMLIGLRRTLTVGDSISLSLLFQNSGTVEVSVPVRTRGGS